MHLQLSDDGQIIMLVLIAVIFVMLAVKLFRLAFLLALAVGVYYLLR